MAHSKKERTGWQFKALAVLLTTAAIAGIFGVSYSAAGNEVRSVMNAAVPVLVGLVVAFLLGKIGRLSDNRWQIYVAALLLAAVFMVMRIYRIV